MTDQMILSMTSLDEIISTFILDRKSKKRSKNTILFYQSELNTFRNWANKNECSFIGDITPNLLRRYFIDLGLRRSKGGCYANFKAIKALLIFFEIEFEPTGWKNPIFKVKVESNNIDPLPGISIENVSKMLAACSGEYAIRNLALIQTLVNTGCRSNELINLSIGDLDLISGAINCRFGKGDKQRKVYLFSPESRKAVRRYLKTRENIKPNSPLFLSSKNSKFTYQGLKYVMKTISKKAGIDIRPTLHDFRRCFGKTIYTKTKDIFLVSKLLGHSNLEITKRYISLNDDEIRNSIDINPFDDL